MSTDKPLILAQDTFAPTTKGHYEARRAVQQSISHGYNDLVHGRMRPWKQAKAEADRMRALN